MTGAAKAAPVRFTPYEFGRAIFIEGCKSEMIKSCEIKRFKSINELSADLDNVNVLVGTNNSGKSSLLQALHFATSLSQSRKLIGSSNFNFTIAPQQILYAPVADIASLSPQRNLTQDKAKEISIGLTANGGENALIGVRRGKNKNLNVKIEGDAGLISHLENLDSPFSVYVPGLAGLAKTENLVSKGLLTRAIARGDANLVLRNVLRQLSQDEGKWDLFMHSLQKVFPNATIKILFDEPTDEFIEVEVAFKDFSLPIDAAGTGFLQTVQILSYIFLFQPAVLLLDEPDSHLHPNNQRTLVRLLLDLAGEGKTQVIIATHSRHILDELQDEANFIWMREGGADKRSDNLSVLVELGALDSAEGLVAKGIKHVISY